MKLNPLQVKNAKPRTSVQKLSDGHGLYLRIEVTGRKHWYQKYRFMGKEKVLAHGAYPGVSLSEARQKTQEAKRLLSQHIDPMEDRKRRKREAVHARLSTFELLATEWFGLKSQEWSPKHAEKIEGRLKNYILPAIGPLPIDKITVPIIVPLLQAIQKNGLHETASRVLQIISQVFRYALVLGKVIYDPAPALRTCLIASKPKHHAAILDLDELGRLMHTIDRCKGSPSVIAVLKLTPLLFLRPGELRGLEWSEVDLDKGAILIPGDKMKIGEPLIVPLSHQAKEILREQMDVSGKQRFVFPSSRGGSRPISENGARTALLNLEFGLPVTLHGFRATARTLLDEQLRYRVDWIEHQLAHTVKDPNGRAYNRTKYLDERTEMMQKWADYLDDLKNTYLQQGRGLVK